MSKFIGIVSTSVEEDYIGIHKDLMAVVDAIDATPIIIPLLNEEEFKKFANVLDGILLPGGADVDPSRYGKNRHIYTGWQNPFLEMFDTKLLPLMIGVLPIFGICRGFQTLNVQFGGTLTQHLFWHPYSNHKEHLVHEVKIEGDKKYKVNSFHHQGIQVLGKGLIPVAKTDKGLIEGFVHEKYKIAGVQWHPERSFDDFGLDLMRKTFA